MNFKRRSRSKRGKKGDRFTDNRKMRSRDKQVLDGGKHKGVRSTRWGCRAKQPIQEPFE